MKKLPDNKLLLTTMRQLLITFALMLAVNMNAAGETIMRIDAAERHQRITGFGGFVCSPQFGYNHMSTEEINKVWGKNSVLGCNIARLYLPVGKNSWSSSLPTARQLKQMGLTVFASPWGQPAEWKTNNSSNAVEGDEVGYLKEENYADYAQYLNDYVDYLADNGVALDAISMQNEPDMRCTYAGCIWTPAQVAAFVKAYGAGIHCPFIAAESVGFSDSYANALAANDVIGNFNIYGAHQYGGIQNAFKKLAEKGKEVWMTEYLINWNENSNASPRNFSWDTDGFDFAEAVNRCMLNDVNAWVHYATKRFYGMIGDGQYGTTNGSITKRGYVLGQFAKFVTGYTRIGHTFTGGNSMTGSAYLSQSGDTVAAVIINSGSTACQLKLDLPFYTQKGRLVTTGRTQNMRQTAITVDAETFRPTTTIPAKSVCTVLFFKSAERPVSDMTGQTVHYDMIENQKRSSASFGTAYRLSGATVTFDHSHPIISGNTTASNGQLNLNGDYDRLVMHVNSVSSTMNLNTSNTTLYYVNGSGKVSSHNYGTVDFSAAQDFDIVFDTSRKTLTDGCRALLGITNNNWSSVLTIKFGDVYLQSGNGHGFRFSGTFSRHDSNFMDCLEDADCAWMDMTAVKELTSDGLAMDACKNANSLLLADADAGLTTANTVLGDQCRLLQLTAEGGTFHSPKEFTATEAQFSVSVNGARMVVMPFEADIPQGAAVYTLQSSGASVTPSPVTTGTIAAGQPVLVMAQGTVTFHGSGTVSTPAKVGNDGFAGTYESVMSCAGDYLLANHNGQWGFERRETDGTLPAFDARYVPAASVTDTFIPITGVTAVQTVEADDANGQGNTTFTPDGRRAMKGEKGLMIRGGKAFLK